MKTDNTNSKWFLIVILLVLLMLGGYYFFNKNKTFPTEENNITIKTTTEQLKIKDKNRTEKVPKSVKIEKPKPFDYIPPIPVNGKLKAVIELGADGFNYFIVKLDKNENWDKVKYKWGLSLLYEDETLFEPKMILKRIKNAISKIQTKYKVKDIYFLISSGALNLPITKEIIQVVESRYIVEKITKEREGKFAFYATVPKKFRNNSFIVDIGSNNTKIAWLDNKNNIVTRTTYGAKYYKHNLGNQEVYDTVKAKAIDIPKNRRKHCFIIGGAPYKLAKKIRKDKKERYTVLYYPEDYLENYEEYGIELEGKVEAGLNIYKAIFDTTGTKQFIFDWNSNFTIGFLLKRKF